MTRRIVGGCLCGSVRYVATGEPINVRACHCRLCQRAIGAPFNARALYRSENVTIEGTVARYASSADLVRGFCSRCGTTLFSERDSQGLVGLTLGSMDDPNECPPPSVHIWTGSRQDWLQLHDGFVQHSQGAPV